jgi:protocatechuate 3,4-dioxygenase beta subunit
LYTVAVNTNGTYTFTNLLSAAYVLELSTNAGTVGSPAPAMALPAGWVNVGESTNGAIAGNTNGWLPVQLGTVLTNANFGLDQLPTSLATNASYNNPGGAGQVTVPALLGTDPEQGALGGATNTVVITMLPGFATLYYNGLAVQTGQVITNYTPSLLTLHPTFGGSGTTSFTFAIEDGANQQSAASATVNLSFTVNVSGTVFDDANGLSDGSVNGAATNATGLPLYVNLVSSGGNVVATTVVATNGAYQLTNLTNATYTLQLTTNLGAIGSAEPVTGLPANWVNTGESTNGVSDGTPNGLLPINLVANITTANFGLDQAPTSLATNASYLNPGGTLKVTVPALLGTDPEQGPLGGLTNTVVIKSLATNATLYYNGVGVSLNQNIPNYNPANLTLDPSFDGAGVVSFTFAIEDAAGQPSLAPATVTLTFTGLTLGGTVFDDANGLTDGSVNGTGTNLNGALYANLISGGTVVTNEPIAASGSYNFTNLDSLTYTVQLTTNAGVAGTGQPATSLRTNWVYVGESTNGILAGTPNGLITIALTASVTTANFGLDQLPTSLATNATYLNPGGTNQVVLPALPGTDPEQGALGGTTNRLEINTLPVGTGTIYYNGQPVIAGQIITNYNPALLTLDPLFEGAGTVSFASSILDAAGQASAVPATNIITFTAITLAGTVFNDTNGLTDGTVNGTGTNLAGALYVNLLNAASNVLATVAVAANGTYSFANISGGSDILQLTVNAGTVGLAAPATALPAGWVNTGEFLGTGAGNDGNPNGLLAVSLSGNTANADFGIWQLGSLAGQVIYDVNGNGVQDAGDTNGIAGVVITLKTNGVTAATTTTSASGAYQFNNVPAGAYTIVQTVPSGATATTPTSLAVTLASGQNSANNNFLDTGTGAIGGLVWYDLNGNGTQNAGEPTVSGARVFVDVNGNGIWDAGEPYQITGANGSYNFTNLLPGTYSIVVDTNTLLQGVVCTHDRDGNNNSQTTIVLAAGQTVSDATFGYEPFFSLGNEVYMDLNNDGNRDLGETNISGVRLVLFASDVSGNPTGSLLASMTTDSQGFYRFDGLAAGTYVVMVDQSNSPNLFGCVSSTGASTDYTLAGAQLDHGKDTPVSYGGVINGIISTPVTVGVGLQPTNEPVSATPAGKHGPTGDINDNLVLDFSFTPTYSIGNRVFCDNGAGGGVENNGLQDGTEPGISNVLVRLFTSDASGNPTSGILATTNTDVNGYYRFDGLVTGTYVVMVDQLLSTNLAKLVSSTGYDTNAALADDLKDHGKDTPVTITGVITNGIISAPVTLGSGLQPTGEATGSGAGAHGPTGDASDNLTLDFGFAPAYSVGNQVFADSNNNGVRDAGEPGIANVNVHLYAADGTGQPTGAILQETFTDSNGYYRFDGVAAGKYVAVVHVLGSAGALNGYQCSSTTSTDFSLAGDLHNHGNPTPLGSSSVLPGGIATAAFTLGVGLEPLGEAIGTSGAATNGPTGDANDNLVVAFGFAPSSQFFSVGNRVFLDNGAGGGVANNGIQDGTEPGIANVAMALFAANEAFSPVGTPLATTNTDVNGYYRFDNLPPGNYVVVVDVANSSALTGLLSSHGASTDFTIAGDKKDHGLDTAVTVGGITGGISSTAFSLGAGLQPTGEATGLGAGANGPQGDANDNLTVDFGFAPSADFFSIGHRVFNDNGAGIGGIANNGIQDGSEPGISNVVMLLFQANGSGQPTGAALASQTTDANGYYRFDGMGPGTYVVVADQANSPALATYLPSPVYTTATNTASQFENHALPTPVTVTGAVTNGIASVPVTVGASLQPTGEQLSGTGAGGQSSYGDSADNLTLNFGFTPTYSIGNWVFLDPDNDGRPDLSRFQGGGITNVPMYVYAADGSGSPTGSALGNVRTDTNGYYRFDGLLAGTYVVVVDKLNAPNLNGYVVDTVLSTDNTLSGDSINHGKSTPLAAGSVLPGGIASVPVTLGWGLEPTNEGVAPGLGGNGPAGDAFDNLVIDFGFTPVASLAGQVNVDVNGNGIADPADTAPIYPVVISVYDNTSTLVATVTNNADGTYAVTNLSPGSYTVVETVPGGFLATSPTTLPVTLTSAENATGLNFLDSRPVTVEGDAWLDANGNGLQDLGEIGLGGIQVVLYATNSGLATLTAVTTNTTFVSGSYAFSNLLPGNYVVGFGLPVGYIRTQPYQGSLAEDSHARTSDGLTELLSPTSGQTITSVDAGYYEPANLSGNVFDDANGLSDGTVNGIGTNIQGTLQMNLIGSDGNVFASQPVAADGSYGFVNLPVTNYTLQLSGNAGVVGQTPPATTLPSGWVHTGENVGVSAGNDGTPDGWLAVNLTGNLANANFGIDQLPASLPASTNYLNPGGTLTVLAPALIGTDPEQGPLGDGTNTVKIVSLPSNGFLYYNSVAVTAGQVIPNFSSADLTLDPDFEGAGVVTFTFKIEDAAGQASAAPATITINFTGVSVSGNVYDDANGLTDLIVNGTGTNIDGALYVNLVNQGGTVLAHTAVQSDGTYGFSSLSGGNVTLQLSTNAGVTGSAMPASALTPGWVFTGENLGAGPGNDGGVPDGRLSFSLTNNLSNANFGIDQLPTSIAASTNYLNPGGLLTVLVPALTGVDPEEGALGGTTNTVVIVTLPDDGILYYQGVPVTAGEVIPNYDPASLTLDPAFEGAGTVDFNFEIEDSAGEASAAPATITINFTGVSLSGNVYDDLNGLADATVNGTGTNINGTLYVNVINPGGTVLTNTTVLSDGSYLIPNLSGGNITLQLSTIAGVLGQAEPVTTLPAGWVNTGENLGAGPGDDGNPNGLLSVTLTGDQASANFGIDQLPTSLAASASYLNPGSGNTVTVPALTGIDPEQGPLGGNTNTVVISTLPGNGTLYYNGLAVTVGQVIANYNPAWLSFAPNYDGAGTSTFTFVIEDAAGEPSLVPATVTLTFTGLTLGGSVFDDTNGLTDGLVNGTGTNINGGLYANLLASGNVLASVPVAVDGSYGFTNLDSLTYTVQLSTSAGSVGSAQPATALPAGWVNVGASTNGVSAGNPNGLLTVALTSSVIANFGIDQLPTALATNASYLNAGTAVTVPALRGTDPEQGMLGGCTNTVVIVTLPGNGILDYNGAAVTVGQVIPNYNPAKLTLDPSFAGAGVVNFNFNIEDAAGQSSAAPATVTLTFTALTLSGTVFNDTNGLGDGLVNGIATNATGTALYLNLADTSSNVLASVPVGNDGSYSFTNLSSETYIAQLSLNAGSMGSTLPATALPSGWVNTGESTNNVPDGNADGLLTVALTTSVSDADFGIAQAVTIGDYTWLDVNGNGIQDAGEPSLGGVTVVLFQTNALTQSMTAVATNLSDPNGAYLFTNLAPGVYQLQFIAPAAGYSFSPAFQGSDPAMNSHADPTTGDTPILVYMAGTVDLTENAGFLPNPTAVAEVGLQASVVAGQIWVSWQTYSEAGLLAFDVTRTAPDGVVVDVTPDYVFASGQEIGANYSVLDAGASPAGNYTYKLYGYYDDLSIVLLATAKAQLTTSAVPAPSQPSLSINITSSGVHLSWSGGQAPYVVEQSASLGADAVWQVVQPATTSTELTIPLTGQSGFFRIRGN